MAYPNMGPGMYNSYLALVGVYKLLVMNNIITLHIHTCLRSLNGYRVATLEIDFSHCKLSCPCLPERRIWSLQSLRVTYANRATNTKF